jgi:hypothetical protein
VVEAFDFVCGVVLGTLWGVKQVLWVVFLYLACLWLHRELDERKEPKEPKGP